MRKKTFKRQNKRNEVIEEIKLAQRRDVQNKIDHKNPKKVSSLLRRKEFLISDTDIKGKLTANVYNYFLNDCEPGIFPISDC